uniref:MACPF domain-containing protein n=1 Tax=Sinocyclocheilus grahami TaxID=75366 RepID=A0A672N5D1_SINGR
MQVYLVVFWALLLMTISGEDDKSASKECEDAPFVPGYNLAGEGFDVVTMERKGSYVINTEKWDLGNGTCKLRKNKYINGIQQKLPTAVSPVRFESSEALVNDSSSALSVGWKVGLDVKAVGAAVGSTHSREAKFAKKRRQIQYHVVENPPLQTEFLQAIKSLPASYDPDAYRNLITTYGTHYTKSVMLGGQMKAITAIKTCQAAVSGLTDTAVKDCLDVVHRILFFFGSSHPNSLKNWLKSLKSLPELLKYTSFKMPSWRFALSLARLAGSACVCESSQIIKSNCCPAEKGLATLKVYNLRAKDLYGDTFTQTDGTVTVTYGTQIKRTETLVIITIHGPQCNEHKPSPMTVSLADIFSSRNGVLIKDLPRLELALNNSDNFSFKSTYGKLMML